MADQEQIFPEGVRVFSKHANAPSFVKATVVITVNELVKFCKANQNLLTDYNGEKQLKLQLLESKGGKLYAQVDTYKGEPKAKPQATAAPLEDPADDSPF